VSRWPRGIDAAYLKHESEQRFARVEAVMDLRRRDFERHRPLREPIIDRDPGDENEVLK
jgi:hypothetical protein